MAMQDMMKKKKLSGLSMPSKRGDDGLELDLLGSKDSSGPDSMSKSPYDPDQDGDDDSMDSNDNPDLTEDMGSGDKPMDPKMLASIPDDELLAEIKKRGLDKDLEDGEGDDSSDDQDDSKGSDSSQSDDDDFSLRA